MARWSTPGELHNVLAETRSLYVSACAAEIVELPDMLEDWGLRDATITGLFSPLVNQRSYADAERGLRVRTFLLTRALKQDVARGLVDFCPWRYRMIDRWMQEPGRFDTAIVMLSPPDGNGMCSFGVQADFAPSFLDRVDRVIGFINPHLPATSGHTPFPFDRLAHAVDYDRPLLEMGTRDVDDASLRIATAIVERVDDGATIQLGTGQIPSIVLSAMAGHRDLRVHTGIIDDNILKLLDAGALADAPIVTGTAIGSRLLYSRLADARQFQLAPVSFTHAPGSIASARAFTAINSVLQVDLLGQVSGEAIGGRIAAAPGGLPDFARGAQESPGGQSIIALKALGASGRQDGIVPFISDPAIVTNGGVDAHIVVTEYGAADLRGLSMDKRAEAVIGIAAPERRAGLQAAWDRMHASAFAGNRPRRDMRA